MDAVPLVRIVCALAVIVALLCAVAVVRRLNVPLRMPGGRRLISVIETTALPNACALHVVKILDCYYVIGSAGGHVSVLCPVDRESVQAHFARNAPRTERGLPQ